MWSRLCDHAAAVPAAPRRLRGLLGVQFLDTVIDMPAFVHVVFVVLKTVEVPQLQYLSRWSMFSSCSSTTGWTSLCSCSDVFAVLDIVVDMPVASNDWCFGLTEQKTVVVPQLQCSVKVYDVPVVQVVDWVSCWRCLKFSSSPEFVDLPVCTETGGFQRGFGGVVGLGIFCAPPGRPGVERQFSEPSMTKSSLLSRAPAT